jgi:hypothetical protein
VPSRRYDEHRPGRGRSSINNRAKLTFSSEGAVFIDQAAFQTLMMHINWAVARYGHSTAPVQPA